MSKTDRERQIDEAVREALQPGRGRGERWMSWVEAVARVGWAWRRRQRGNA